MNPALRFWTCLVFVVLGCAASARGGAATMDLVKQRGVLRCGVSQGVPGFSIQDSQGAWKGLDADLCRAVAAALLRDAAKVHFIPLSAKDRFTALQSGEVDLLSRSTTWTLSRDSAVGINFRAVTYYDGQGFLVRKSLGISSAAELHGASVCTPTGTTSELNAADYFRSHNRRNEILTFASLDEAAQAYASGRCDALTVDVSQLQVLRLRLERPGDHVILADIISKEPLGPAVRQGDDRWFDVVSWVHYAMVAAEELGLASADVEKASKSSNPEIRRLIGVEGNLGASLGLPSDWAYQIISQVGNYGEAFERNLGSGSPLMMPRGLNRLWTSGGLQYAPPFR